MAVEVDQHWVVAAEDALDILSSEFADAGLPTTGGVMVRKFKTGSVSGFAKQSLPS